MMETLTTKHEFHQLIDRISNEQYLTDLYKSVATYVTLKTDVLDELSEAELKRLDESLEQIEQGRVIADAVAREKY